MRSVSISVMALRVMALRVMALRVTARSVLVCSVLACSVTACAVLAASGARAADLPTAPPAATAPAVFTPAPPPAYNWTSLYGGANAGFGFATATATAAVPGASASASENLDGFVGGGQIGANYQIGWAVLGIEGDMQYADQTHTITAPGVTETDTIDWISTLRGRLGAAFDRFLVYGTAGGGWGDFTTTVTLAGVGTASGSQSHAFWTAGGGVEVGITPDLSAKIEYLYLDTGNFNVASVGLLNVTGRVQDNLVRAGINLRLPR